MTNSIDTAGSVPVPPGRTDAFPWRFRLLRSLLVLQLLALAGYAFANKSFAYLGVGGPLRIGDYLLLLSAAVVLVPGRTRRLRLNAVWLPLLLWIGYSALRTVPYFSSEGIDALRDGATWGYALYAFVTAKLLLTQKSANDLVLAAFDRFARLAIVLFPILFAVHQLYWVDAAGALGSAGFFFKFGDTFVHLAAITVGIAMGILPSGTWRLALITLTVLLLAAKSRAGLVSYGLSVTVLALVSPRMRRLLVRLAIVVLCLGALLGLATIALDLDQGSRRSLSATQIVENVASIFSDDIDTDTDVVGTKSWRLDWWTSIVNYTIFGEHFWSGKGYGINLATDDGFQVVDRFSGYELLRSPHNIFMTILARSGVPGLALWVWFNAAWLIVMLKLFHARRHAGQQAEAGFAAVLIAYWIAMLVNASFDVYLEGPMGAIWFWSVIGVGAAQAQLYRREVSAARRSIPDGAAPASPG